MKEKYKFYKLNYSDYIIIFKIGNFYNVLNDDCIVLNNIFNYKIVDKDSYIKTGFPYSSLDKVITKLDIEHINYLVIENNNILDKHNYEDNHYSHYQNTINQYNYGYKKINYLFKYLKDNLLNDNINDIVEQIEEIIWQINS